MKQQGEQTSSVLRTTDLNRASRCQTSRVVIIRVINAVHVGTDTGRAKVEKCHVVVQRDVYITWLSTPFRISRTVFKFGLYSAYFVAHHSSL
jgi:hypothetical protein